jgi:hypothetical protein
MAKTKSEVVRTALAHLGIADYDFDIIPEELATGVDFLNLMMSFWSSKNLKVPYNFEGETEDDSGIPEMALEAVTTNLALRLAPTYGKQVSMDVRTLAKQGLNALYGDSAKPLNMQLPNMPRGAGYKTIWQSRFVPRENRFPWVIDDQTDYSGGESDFYVDAVGVVFSHDFFGNVDLSTATTTVIHYRKPDGEEGEWTGTVSGENVQYTTVADDIDQSGVWYTQAFATYADGTIVASKIEARWVAPTIQDGT